jgi:hypothetical protein
MRHAFLACLIVILIAGCGAAGSGRRTVAASGFTGVSTEAGIDVEVTTSTGWSVEVSADRLALDRIVVEVRGTILWIGLRAGTLARARYLASMGRVGIAMPVLERLDVTGGSTARVSLAQPHSDLTAALMRGSTLAGSLACAELTISASGSSVARLSGTADRVSLTGSDRADMKLSGLETASLDANLSGGSIAAVAVSGHLTVRASGGSGLSFRGDARVDSQELSGGSWLRKE